MAHHTPTHHTAHHDASQHTQINKRNEVNNVVSRLLGEDTVTDNTNQPEDEDAVTVRPSRLGVGAKFVPHKSETAAKAEQHLKRSLWQGQRQKEEQEDDTEPTKKRKEPEEELESRTSIKKQRLMVPMVDLLIERYKSKKQKKKKKDKKQKTEDTTKKEQLQGESIGEQSLVETNQVKDSEEVIQKADTDQPNENKTTAVDPFQEQHDFLHLGFKHEEEVKNCKSDSTFQRRGENNRHETKSRHHQTQSSPYKYQRQHAAPLGQQNGVEKKKKKKKRSRQKNIRKDNRPPEKKPNYYHTS